MKYLIYRFISLFFATILFATGCASTQQNIYQELGGQATIEKITDHFLDEISYDPQIARYFENSDIERYREKFNEYLCVVLEGPCEYTGDDMLAVHRGMNITESHFNLTVDLLINAMDKAGIPHPTQNKVLAALAPLRSKIIYL